MAKREDDTAAALAEALAGGLSAGSLEVALHAARAYHNRAPGNEDAKRVLEALELLQAQVWFSGTDDDEDPRYGTAAQHLDAVDLPGALARYEEVAEKEGSSSRATGLALAVRVVMAAAAGDALPKRAGAAEPPPPAPAPVFQETTRIAGDGELPLSAFEDDDRTANRAAVITKDAYREEEEDEYREEVTRHLNLGDYEILDEEAPKKKPPPLPPQFSGFEEDEHTAYMDLDQKRELAAKTAMPEPAKKKKKKGPAVPPPPPRIEKEITRIAGADELPLDDFRKGVERSEAKKKVSAPPKVEKEVTRIVGANELPLEELRRQMEGDAADRDLDALMVEVDTTKPGAAVPEVSVQIEVASARSSRAEPKPAPKRAPKPAPKPAPPPAKAPEPSLMLDITVMPDFEAEAVAAAAAAEEEEDAPTPVPQPKRPVIEASVAIDISELPDFEAEAIERAVAEAAAAEAEEEAAAEAARTTAVHDEPLTPPPMEFEDTPPRPVPVPPAIVGKKVIDGAPSAEEDVLYPPPEIYEEPPPLMGVDLDDNTMPGVRGAEPSAPVVVAPPRGPVVPRPPGMAGPVVPKPPGVVGPVVPKPPGAPPAMATPAPLTSDPIHAPLESSEVALPPEAWVVREPGHDEEQENVAQVHVGLADTSWSGVQSYGAHTATFEPGAESVEADTWGDPAEGSKSAEERTAEAMLARGELGEALRIYQDLAAQHPEQPELWDRVAAVARMLQQRSGG